VIQWLLEEADDSNRSVAFFRLLHECIRDFEYAGIESRKSAQTDFTTILAFENTSMCLEGGEDYQIDDSKALANIEKIMSGLANRTSSIVSRGAITSPEGLFSPSRSTTSSSSTGRLIRTGTGTSPSPRMANGTLDKTGKKPGSKSRSYHEQRQALLSQGSLRKTKKGTTTGKGTLTLNDDSILAKIVNWEAHLNIAVTYTVVSIAVKSLHEFEKNRKLSLLSVSTWAEIGDLFVALLKYNQSDDMYLALYSVVRTLFRFCSLPDASTQQLMKDFQFMSQLCQNVLKHCTVSVEEMRQNAVCNLYLAAKTSFVLSNSFDLFQEAVTYSLTSMVQRLKGNGALYLKQSFDAVCLLKDVDSSGNAKFLDVMSKVNQIYDDTLEIARQEKLGNVADPSFLEDLLMNMADQYNHLPEVRRDWIAQLARHHLKIENFAEAGYCFEEEIRLLLSGRIRLPNSEDLETVLDGLFLAAVQALDNGLLFEECNQIYLEKLLPRLTSRKLYHQLRNGYSHLSAVVDKLIQAVSSASAKKSND